MLSNKSEKRNWNQDDITILVWILVHYQEFKAIKFQAFVNYKKFQKLAIFNVRMCLVLKFLQSDSDWVLIASMVPGKTVQQCQFKMLQLLQTNIMNAPWTNYEDEILSDLVSKYGKKAWSQISQELYTLCQEKTFRSAKQCREHYNNYLDPTVKKGTWTREQDLELLKLTKEKGKKWSEIARILVGRTQNSVKNRYNALFRKQLETNQIYYVDIDQKGNKDSTDYQVDPNQDGSVISQLIHGLENNLFIRENSSFSEKSDTSEREQNMNKQSNPKQNSSKSIKVLINQGQTVKDSKFKEQNSANSPSSFSNTSQSILQKQSIFVIIYFLTIKASEHPLIQSEMIGNQGNQSPKLMKFEDYQRDLFQNEEKIKNIVKNLTENILNNQGTETQRMLFQNMITSNIIDSNSKNQSNSKNFTLFDENNKNTSLNGLGKDGLEFSSIVSSYIMNSQSQRIKNSDSSKQLSNHISKNHMSNLPITSPLAQSSSIQPLLAEGGVPQSPLIIQPQGNDLFKVSMEQSKEFSIEKSIDKQQGREKLPQRGFFRPPTLQTSRSEYEQNQQREGNNTSYSIQTSNSSLQNNNNNIITMSFGPEDNDHSGIGPTPQSDRVIQLGPDKNGNQTIQEINSVMESSMKSNVSVGSFSDTFTVNFLQQFPKQLSHEERVHIIPCFVNLKTKEISIYTQNCSEQYIQYLQMNPPTPTPNTPASMWSSISKYLAFGNNNTVQQPYNGVTGNSNSFNLNLGQPMGIGYQNKVTESQANRIWSDFNSISPLSMIESPLNMPHAVKTPTSIYNDMMSPPSLLTNYGTKKSPLATYGSSYHHFGGGSSWQSEQIQSSPYCDNNFQPPPLLNGFNPHPQFNHFANIQNPIPSSPVIYSPLNQNSNNFHDFHNNNHGNLSQIMMHNQLNMQQNFQNNNNGFYHNNSQNSNMNINNNNSSSSGSSNSINNNNQQQHHHIQQQQQQQQQHSLFQNNNQIFNDQSARFGNNQVQIESEVQMGNDPQFGYQINNNNINLHSIDQKDEYNNINQN